jgi:REP-associated tyrosine transposase
MGDRKSLPHQPPWWVDPNREIWFLTLNCLPRGENHLARTDRGPAIFESILNRQERRLWWPHLFLLMPDHCHTLITFPESRLPWTKVVRDWKRWLARSLGICWQIDFFDHRLRNDESLDEKSSYILANPVRAGLAKSPEDWPYVYRASDFEETQSRVSAR